MSNYNCICDTVQYYLLANKYFLRLLYSYINSDTLRPRIAELATTTHEAQYLRPKRHVHLFACLIKVHKRRSLTATPKFHKCVNMRRNNIQAVTPMPLERHSATAHQSTTGKR